MKHVFFWGMVFLFSLQFIACGSDDGDHDPLAEDEGPTVPTLLVPSNNKRCTDTTLMFRWSTATDPNGDSVSYELQLADNSSFTAPEKYSSTTNSESLTVEKGKVYHWRVRGNDGKGEYSDYFNTFQFVTEGGAGGNHTPFAPSLVKPVVDTMVQGGSVLLGWSASDVDPEDELVFDIYFDTVNPPNEKVASDQLEKHLERTVSPASVYFWKVVAKDNHGAEATSAIWKFKTE
ncbi:MAG: hypothetical protein AB3N16_03015 [Flavobacteriaceae bacterium]